MEPLTQPSIQQITTREATRLYKRSEPFIGPKSHDWQTIVHDDGGRASLGLLTTTGLGRHKPRLVWVLRRPLMNESKDRMLLMNRPVDVRRYEQAAIIARRALRDERRVLARVRQTPRQWHAVEDAWRVATDAYEEAGAELERELANWHANNALRFAAQLEGIDV